tara:strand:+ start:162 stop:485 length:324 start_codon:yes stop_codon:yes gene_type:complete
MRVLLLAPILLLCLAGCSGKEDLKKIQGPAQNKQEELLQPSLLDSIEVEEKLKTIKNDLEKIEIDSNQVDQLINRLEKSALELVDECIDAQKSKGLPIYECTKLMKP